MGDDILGSNKSNGSYSLSSLMLVYLNKMQQRYINDWTIVKSEQMYTKFRIKNNLSIIPNGVDLRRFYSINKEKARQILRLKKNINYILFAADPCRHEKNYQLAKKAVSICQEENKNIEILVIFGVNQEQLNLYYNAVDLLLLTSFHEGSPNIIKEAMACSIPIVSTDVGDVRKVIEKTKGCYISSFDPSDISENIRRALSFTKRTTGREDINHLEANIIAQKIIDIYKNIAKKGCVEYQE